MEVAQSPIWSSEVLRLSTVANIFSQYTLNDECDFWKWIWKFQAGELIEWPTKT